MSKLWLRIFSLSLLLISNSAIADETAQENQDYFNLSIHSAVERTLKSNVSISVQAFNSKIREKTVIDKQAEFDPNLTAGLSTDKRKQQIASVFAQPNVSINENVNWSVGLKQKAMTGGSYLLQFDS